MNEQTRRVVEFHHAFGCPVRERPGFSADLPGSVEHFEVFSHFADDLATMANDLKLAATRFNNTGRVSIGELLTRLQLHVEETAELAEALMECDLVKALDALTDLKYVNKGTHLVLGTAELEDPAFSAVHHSNMTKLDPNGAPPRYASGRVIKGPNYKDPKEELRALVKAAQNG